MVSAAPKPLFSCNHRFARRGKTLLDKTLLDEPFSTGCVFIGPAAAVDVEGHAAAV
jgi:hypothetical protein